MKGLILKDIYCVWKMMILCIALISIFISMDVYHIQGTGKNRTQQITIHYKFIGVLELPKVRALQDNVTLNSQQGVEIEYLVGKAG